MALLGGPFASASPGPTSVPNKIQNVMHADAVNIYDSFAEAGHVAQELCKVARTRHHCKIQIGNGHLAWDMALANTVCANDLVLVIDSGTFAQGWTSMARHSAVLVETMAPLNPFQCVNEAALAERLKQDAAEQQIKAVLVCHTDTGTGLHHDIKAVRRAMDSAGHTALLLVDCIATLACVEFEMDVWGVDVAVAGSQKGLMLPVGLCFTFFNEKALSARRSKQQPIPMYLDWLVYVLGATDEVKPLSVGTPASQLMNGLKVSLDMLLREQGLDKTWQRHEIFARAVWAAVKAWGQAGPIHILVKDPSQRSHTVTVVLVDGYDCRSITKWCKEEANLLVPGPVGQSIAPERAFRIGHMGHMNSRMLLGILATIDCAFKALDVPHGTGALNSAACVLANAWRDTPTDDGPRSCRL